MQSSLYIAPGSQRHQAMERTRARWEARSLQRPHRPGWFVARVTRGYTKEEEARGAGLWAERLRQYDSNKGRGIPIYVRHDRDPRRKAGQVEESEYVAEENFLLAANQLSVGDGGAGDYAHAERQKGKLGFVSCAFTAPHPQDPHPERHVPELVEISLVDEPHEPYATVLVSHATKDANHPQPVINLCSKIDQMSSQQQQPDAAALATPEQIQQLLEQNKRLMADNEKLQGQLSSVAPELESLRASYTSRTAPIRNSLSQHIAEHEKLDDEGKKVVSAGLLSLADVPESGPAAEFLHNELMELRQLRAAHSAASAAKAEAEQSASSQKANLEEIVNQTLAQFQQHQQQVQVPQPNVPTPSNMPATLVSHSKGAPKSSAMADRLAAMYKSRIAEMNGETPDAKRTA